MSSLTGLKSFDQLLCQCSIFESSSALHSERPRRETAAKKRNLVRVGMKARRCDVMHSREVEVEEEAGGMSSNPP